MEQKSLDEYSRVAQYFILQLADYQGEGVLSCVGLLLLQKIMVPEPLPGKEGGQEDPKVG